MKTAIVTGGAHGIGKAIVQKLLAEKCLVIILDSNEEYLIQLNKELNVKAKMVETIRCDVGNPEEVKLAMHLIQSNYTQVNYLVNNAGISLFEPIDLMTVETWNRIISVNLSSIFYCVKFVQPFLSDNSSIVNIASSRALMSESNGEAYGATKGGIVALTHALAVSLGPKTRVNCISPGWIEVNNYHTLSEADHLQHPCGKVGTVEDVAETAFFLLSEKSKFITGQNMVVDGGMTKKMIYI